MKLHPTQNELAVALATGETSSQQLVEESLVCIADLAGEGARAFIKVDAEGARGAADKQDILRKAGRASSRFAGRGLGRGDCFRPFTSHASGVVQTFVLGTSLMLVPFQCRCTGLKQHQRA